MSKNWLEIKEMKNLFTAKFLSILQTIFTQQNNTIYIYKYFYMYLCIKNMKAPHYQTYPTIGFLNFISLLVLSISSCRCFCGLIRYFTNCDINHTDGSPCNVL